MNYMPYDTIYEICLQLDYDDIDALCKSEVIMDICGNKFFWMDKLRHDGIPFSPNYTVNQLKILYRYKKKLINKNNTYVTYRVDNLSDVISYLPEQVTYKLGPIVVNPIHKATPIKIIFWNNGTYKVNIFNGTLKVIDITEQEALQLIEDLDNYIHTKKLAYA